MTSWAAIFDMDGVIANTNPFHKVAWQAFCRDYSLTLSDADMQKHVYGSSNPDILTFLFGSDLPAARLADLEQEKEALFRELAAGKLPAVEGLSDLLSALEAMDVARAVASSAPPENVAFVLAETGLAHFFSVIVDSSWVKRGKPAPDIYEAAARKLGMPPERCLAFEDSFPGIKSARNAGMTVIGLATTYDAAGLAENTVRVMPDFTELGSISEVTRLAELLPLS